MIVWTLEAARKARSLDHVVVSSDDEAVLALARDHAVVAVRRPAALAGPDAAVVDAVDHVLERVDGDWDEIVLLQPTSPLRTAADIDAAVDLRREAAAPAVVSISPLAKPPGFHAWLDEAGRLVAPPALDRLAVVNGAVYVVQAEAFRRERTFRPEATKGFVMPAERGWDVDTLADFLACEAVLRVAEEASL
jgi:N-acylneuraminate cytidylyltransferase